MKCPLHRGIEMTEHREKVPFAHLSGTEEDGVRHQWRTVAHCPVKGCIQVGLITTDYVHTKSTTSMLNTHV